MYLCALNPNNFIPQILRSFTLDLHISVSKSPHHINQIPPFFMNKSCCFCF